MMSMAHVNMQVAGSESGDLIRKSLEWEFNRMKLEADGKNYNFVKFLKRTDFQCSSNPGA